MSSFIEVVGIHNYCLKEEIIPKNKNIDLKSNNKAININSTVDDESTSTIINSFKFKIGRISDKSNLSFGFSEDYLSGKHYDRLVGFGFGIFGFKPNGEISILYDLNENIINKNIVIKEKIRNIVKGDIISITIDTNYKCCLFINDDIEFEIGLPLIPLYFCISGGTYQGISTIEIMKCVN